MHCSASRKICQRQRQRNGEYKNQLIRETVMFMKKYVSERACGISIQVSSLQTSILALKRRKIKKLWKSQKGLRALEERSRERATFKLFTVRNVVIKPGDTKLGKGIVFSPGAAWRREPTRRQAKLFHQIYRGTP